MKRVYADPLLGLRRLTRLVDHHARRALRHLERVRQFQEWLRTQGHDVEGLSFEEQFERYGAEYNREQAARR